MAAGLRCCSHMWAQNARPSLHLLDCGHPHNRKAVMDNLPDCTRQRQSRAGLCRPGGVDEATRRIVVAAVPMGMKGRCQVTEIKGDTVRLMGDRGCLDDPRKLRGELD